MTIYTIYISGAIYHVHTLQALYSKVYALAKDKNLAEKICSWAEVANSLEKYKSNMHNIVVEIVK